VSYLSHLECSHGHEWHDPKRVQSFCLEHHAPLLPRYELAAARSQLDRDVIRRRGQGMWRWGELLPVLAKENIVSLGEGDTPLLELHNLESQLGLDALYLKDESANPTGTFKARGLSAAVSKAKELGIEKVIIPTAGNAGGAMAAYAARGGLKAQVIMPQDSPSANVMECRIAGAEVTLVDGLISDAAKLAAERASAEGWFDLSTFKEPYRVEGKKIMGYELAEAFDWRLPDVIIYPTGGGTGLIGMWKAFAELLDLGWLEETRLPRMIAVQAEGCAPVVKAWEAGASTCDFWPDAHTVASGLRVPKSFADRLILKDIRESRGAAVAVSDDEIMQAQIQLGAKEGVFAAPEGAATIAGLTKMVAQGMVDSGEKIVCFNTGTGLKYLDQ
jgi:threonine synthase